MPMYFARMISLLALLLAPGTEREVQPDQPECPNHQFRPRDRNGRNAPLDTATIPLVGGLERIPEFHDCQALIVGNTYGPLVAVFASRRPLSINANRARYHAVAVIFNYGTLSDPGVGYEPLNIQPGFSCLYISLRSDSAHLQPREDSRCAASIDPPSTPNLTKRVRVRAADSSIEIPTAARWDWDAKTSQHYIGVKCGRDWCEIGAANFTSSLRPDTNWLATLGLPVHDVHRVPGWYDEQDLAVADPSKPNDALQLSGVRATFFPSPHLEELHQPSAFDDSARYVGTMIITQNHAAYRIKFGLSAGQPTHVYLAKHKKPVPGGYWGEVKFVSDTTIVRPIVHVAHGGMPRAGMVRWRWLWTDETTWIKCLEGCCSTQ